MKIIKNSIRPELISICNNEIDQLLSCRAWSISQTTWNKGLFADDIPGICLSADVSFSIEQKIKKELIYLLPNVDKIIMNYNVFLKNSGIRWHSDANYKFGATLYLNEWNILTKIVLHHGS
jgi:hypothetical protein